MAYDGEVSVVDIVFPRSPTTRSHIWVLHSAFATVEDDGRVVDLEIAVPRALVRRTDLRPPAVSPVRYSLFVDQESAAPEESYLYNNSQRLLVVRFAPPSPDNAFFSLANDVVVELEGARLTALWLSLPNLLTESGDLAPAFALK